MSALTEFPHRHVITAAEYLRMADAGVFAPDARLELMDGAIIEMAPIGSRHASVVNKLAELFHDRGQRRAIVSGQNALHLSDRSVPQPDVVLLKPSGDNYFSALPTTRDVLLLVEVADSTLWYDLGAKARLYARAGIVETWVVDVDVQRLRVFRDRGDEGYAYSEDFSGKRRVAVQALPDVAIEVAELFPG